MSRAAAAVAEAASPSLLPSYAAAGPSIPLSSDCEHSPRSIRSIRCSSPAERPSSAAADGLPVTLLGFAVAAAPVPFPKLMRVCRHVPPHSKAAGAGLPLRHHAQVVGVVGVVG